MSWRPSESLDKGSGGFGSLYKENRKNVLQSAQNYKCQKCLKVGHFTYECKGERKYVQRCSRTEMLKRTLENGGKAPSSAPKKKDSESSSSGSDSSSSSDSDSSSSSSSDSEDEPSTKKKKNRSNDKYSS